MMNGLRTWFWFDLWCGESPSKDSFQNLFIFAENRYLLVADYWCLEDEAVSGIQGSLECFMIRT